MEQLPELTPEHFEILVVRELRKLGLDVSEPRVHRRATLPEPEQGYLLELTTLVTRAAWQRRVLIACRRQGVSIDLAAIDSILSHLREADVGAGLLFATAAFEPEALRAARGSGVALFRVTDGREAFDTSGWGTPGHYPSWLPAYCAQVVTSDALGQVRYQLLAAGQADVLLKELERAPNADQATRPHAGDGARGDS
jgi:Restriction endonuclease